MKRLVLLASLGLGGCATGFQAPAPIQQSEATYTASFPYYVESCALSQIKKSPAHPPDIVGGIGGHATLYLSQVCKVPGANYPVLQLCEGAPVPGRGVGISINAHFRNAAWVATEGRDFFYDGVLRSDEAVTLENYEATRNEARKRGVYDGVIFHDKLFEDRAPGQDDETYHYDVSIGTDYGVGLARDRYCARVPTDKSGLQRVVQYLNTVNQPYRERKQDFAWDVLRQNCVHFIHDAFSVLGLWETWPQQNLLEAALNFPVPKNEFVDLVETTNDLPVDDPLALYRIARARQNLMQHGNLPTRPGAVLEAVPAHRPNEMYRTDVALIFYDEPIFGTYAGRFTKLMSSPRLASLDANLAYFDELYRRAGANADTALQRAKPEERAGFEPFLEKYRSFIRAQQARLGAMR
ncbi:hypothetical protein [Roseiterribacter gracilis]|uniref:DUF4105 domain-containing protein n=1 Tax=Roseiterribacter gracilis TaxID=2812848 RepID=A0A8S8XAE6_9PROT|nr:hypothetical protein TMPK1_04370 [Rhodospirillales bacterium TMPK1]